MGKKLPPTLRFNFKEKFKTKTLARFLKNVFLTEQISDPEPDPHQLKKVGSASSRSGSATLVQTVLWIRNDLFRIRIQL